MKYPPKQYAPVALTLTCTRFPGAPNTRNVLNAEIARVGARWTLTSLDHQGRAVQTFNRLRDALHWFVLEVSVDQHYADRLPNRGRPPFLRRADPGHASVAVSWARSDVEV